MAKYRPSGLIQSISGSVGDVTFSNWKGIPRVGKRIRKGHSPNTLPLMRVKRIFSYLSRTWRDLSFLDFTLWEEYAKLHSRVKTKRRSGLVPIMGGKMSGFNAYMSLNGLLMHCGFETLNHPVLGNIKNPPLVLTDLLDFGVYSNEIRFRVWLPYEYTVRCVVQVWVKKTQRSCCTYLFGVFPLSICRSEVVIDKIRVTEKGKIIEKSLKDIGKGKLFIQMRTVAENGKFSMPSQIYRIQVKGC